MSPRWRKVLQDLWINKTRTILVMLSIAVGVFAIGVIAGTQVILTRETKRAYDATHAASATLSATFDDDYVDSVRRMSQVGDAVGRREVTVRARAGAAVGQRNLLLVAVHDFNDQRLNTFLSAGGAWPPPKRTLLIERSAAADMGVTIGSTVTADLPNGTRRIMSVSGLTYDFQSPPPILGGTAYGYITLDTLEWLGFARTYNRMNIVVATDRLNRRHIQDVADAVKSRLQNDTGITVSGIRIPDPGKPTLDNAMQAILLILGTLGALSLLASGFLIVNVIAALLAQHVRQIGVMKSFGARAYQITGMYLGMVLVFGALGLAVALPLGALGAQWLAGFGAGLLNVDIADISLPPQVLALQVAIGLAVPVLASVYPVIAGTRVTVHQAINSYGVEGGFGETAFDRLIARVRFLSRPLMLSLRNTFRRKGRLAFTLITLTLGGAIFVGVFCVREALLRTLDDAQRYWQYNIVVYTDRFHGADLLERQALSIPGVVQAEARSGGSAERVFPNGQLSRSFSIEALPAQTKLLKPIMVSGRWLLPSDAYAIVINTDVVGDHPDLQVGSTLRIKMDNHQSEWEVVGIARSVLTGRVAYMNYPAYARAARHVGRANSVAVVTDKDDRQTETRIAGEIEDRFKLAGMQTSATLTRSEARGTNEYQYGLLVTFLALMAVLLAFVGGLGLMGTMSINVIERIREIGVLRAIGASYGAVMSIIITEGVFIGVMSWGLGVVLAWPIAHYLDVSLGNTLLRTQLLDTFSYSGAVLWLVIVVVVSGLASFVPAARAARLSVREVLSYE